MSTDLKKDLYDVDSTKKLSRILGDVFIPVIPVLQRLLAVLSI